MLGRVRSRCSRRRPAAGGMALSGTMTVTGSLPLGRACRAAAVRAAGGTTSVARSASSTLAASAALGRAMLRSGRGIESRSSVPPTGTLGTRLDRLVVCAPDERGAPKPVGADELVEPTEPPEPDPATGAADPGAGSPPPPAGAGDRKSPRLNYSH